MSSLKDIIKFKGRFVEEKWFEPYITTKYPNKKLVVVSCMDSRLLTKYSVMKKDYPEKITSGQPFTFKCPL